MLKFSEIDEVVCEMVDVRDLEDSLRNIHAGCSCGCGGDYYSGDELEKMWGKVQRDKKRLKKQLKKQLKDVGILYDEEK